MAKQTFSVGQVLSAANMTSLQQTAMGGGAPVTKTASYTLVAADAGTVIQMNSSSPTTITVNTALFAAGDTVFIQNIGAGTCTITAGTATVTTAGSLALTQWEGGTLYFTSTSASIFFDYIQAGVSIPLTTKGDLFGFDTANARVPIGSNGTVLTADSTQALGLKWAAPAGGGKVLQVVYGSTSTGVATASATYIDTGLTATITPSSTSSKVLVLTNHVECSKNGDTRMRMKLLRGATDILQLGQNTGNTNASTFDNFYIGCSYLDSPATTSATTYKTQFNNQDATGNTQVTGNGTCVSTIILMEIGA